MWRFSTSTSFAVCVGLSLLATTLAQEKEQQKPRLVRDEAKLFSAEAVAKANETVAQIQRKHGKEMLIETVKEIPPDVKDTTAWARERRVKSDVKGIYVVISAKPRRFEIAVEKQTNEAGLFDQADVAAIIAIMEKDLRGNRDDALRKATDYALDRMDRHAKVKAEVKDLLGLWMGPAVKAAAKGKKADKGKAESNAVKGSLYVRFTVPGKSPSIEIGYVVPIGQTPAKGPMAFPIEFKDTDGKRQGVIAKYDAEGQLVLTCEVADGKLRMTSSRKVRVPGIAGEAVDFTGEWTRPPAK